MGGSGPGARPEAAAAANQQLSSTAGRRPGTPGAAKPRCPPVQQHGQGGHRPQPATHTPEVMTLTTTPSASHAARSVSSSPHVPPRAICLRRCRLAGGEQLAEEGWAGRQSVCLCRLQIRGHGNVRCMSVPRGAARRGCPSDGSRRGGRSRQQASFQHLCRRSLGVPLKLFSEERLKLGPPLPHVAHRLQAGRAARGPHQVASRAAARAAEALAHVAHRPRGRWERGWEAETDDGVARSSCTPLPLLLAHAPVTQPWQRGDACRPLPASASSPSPACAPSPSPACAPNPSPACTPSPSPACAPSRGTWASPTAQRRWPGTEGGRGGSERGSRRIEVRPAVAAAPGGGGARRHAPKPLAARCAQACPSPPGGCRPHPSRAAPAHLAVAVPIHHVQLQLELEEAGLAGRGSSWAGAGAGGSQVGWMEARERGSGRRGTAAACSGSSLDRRARGEAQGEGAGGVQDGAGRAPALPSRPARRAAARRLPASPTRPRPARTPTHAPARLGRPTADLQALLRGLQLPSAPAPALARRRAALWDRRHGLQLLHGDGRLQQLARVGPLPGRVQGLVGGGVGCGERGAEEGRGRGRLQLARVGPPQQMRAENSRGAGTRTAGPCPCTTESRPRGSAAACFHPAHPLCQPAACPTAAARPAAPAAGHAPLLSPRRRPPPARRAAQAGCSAAAQRLPGAWRAALATCHSAGLRG